MLDGDETKAEGLTAAAAVHCNACERPRCGKQQAGVGAAVEKIEEKRQPDDFFGQTPEAGRWFEQGRGGAKNPVHASGRDFYFFTFH